MSNDLTTGFTPPDQETPTKYHKHEVHIIYDTDGSVSFRVSWSYGKDDGSGNYQRISRIRTAVWTGADVVSKVTTPDPGTVNTDLHSIADQLLIDGNYVG